MLRIQAFIDRAEPTKRIDHGQPGRVADGGGANLDRQGFGLQPRAVAGFARCGTLIFGQFLAHPRAFGLQQAAIEIADDSVESLGHIIGFAAVHKGQADRFTARAIEDYRLDWFGQLVPRRLDCKAIMAREA